MSIYTVEDRNRLQERVLAWAEEDERVVAGAVVGSLALGDGDSFSDLDLTFGVAEGHTNEEVLESWTERLVAECGATKLFDMPSGAAIYRVFLMPGCLQFDLSFSPIAQFGARGPKFKLLFGESVELPFPEPPSAEHLFGLGAHHALRASFCLERGRFWQAEFWTTSVRYTALTLACRRLELPTAHGRGSDDLPPEITAPLRDAIVRSLEPEELRRALRCAIEGLLREANEARELANRAAAELTKLGEAWPAG